MVWAELHLDYQGSISKQRRGRSGLCDGRQGRKLPSPNFTVRYTVLFKISSITMALMPLLANLIVPAYRKL